MKSKALTIRVNQELHNEAATLAAEQEISLTEFLRQAVQSACNQTQSESNQNDIWKNQLSIKDTQIEKLQKALDQQQQLQAASQKQLEAKRAGFIQKLLTAFN